MPNTSANRAVTANRRRRCGRSLWFIRSPRARPDASSWPESPVVCRITCGLPPRQRARVDSARPLLVKHLSVIYGWRLRTHFANRSNLVIGHEEMISFAGRYHHEVPGVRRREECVEHVVVVRGVIVEGHECLHSRKLREL